MRRHPKRTVVGWGLATGLSLAAACGGPPPPCTDTCKEVAGRYFFDFAATEPESSSCGELYYRGFQGEFDIAQDGSKLTISIGDGVPGVLRVDDSAEFDPFPGTTESGEPGSVSFQLRFLGSPGSLRAEGSLNFIRTRDSCLASAPVQGQQISSG